MPLGAPAESVIGEAFVSFVTFGDENVDEFAPVVAKLTGT